MRKELEQKNLGSYSHLVERFESFRTQQSFKEIRERQSFSLTKEVNRNTLSKLEQLGYQSVLSPNANCQTASGSFDFGIVRINQQLHSVLYEGNGASERGHHTVSEENDYQLAKIINRGYSRLVKPGMNVVLPYKPQDVLAIDRFMIRHEIKSIAEKVISGSHNNLLNNSYIHNDKLHIGRHDVDLILGDGFPRRFDGELKELYETGQLRLIVANGYHPELDQKDRTYEAIDIIKSENPSVAFNLEHLKFAQLRYKTVSHEEGESELDFLYRLTEQVQRKTTEWGGAVIKWPNSSGSAGMRFFLANHVLDKTSVLNSLDQGLSEYHEKIGGNEHNGGVTIQEYGESISFEFHDPEYLDSERVFDARAYWTTTDEGKVIPVSYLLRVAPSPKSEGPAPCNLSAKGRIDMERGFGICQEMMDALKNEIGSENDILEQFSNIGAISVILATEMANRFTPDIKSNG